MSENFWKMFEAVEDQERLCEVCKHRNDSCSGFTAGSNGPIYPPCADKDPQDYVDEDLLKDVYDEIMEEAKG